MTTLATMTLETNTLAAALSAIDTPTQLNRMATLKSDPNLVCWLEADTCFQTSGPNSGWRDRISGALFEPPSGSTFLPVLTSPDSLFNNKSSLLWNSSTGKPLLDGGANLFPGGANQNFSVAAVWECTSGQAGTVWSDNQPSASLTGLYQLSSGSLNLFVDDTACNGFSATEGSAHLMLTSFQYGAGSTSSLYGRLDRGATALQFTGLGNGAQGDTVAVGGFNNSSSGPVKIALLMVWKAPIIQGAGYATQQYSNWSNELYYQILEDYVHAKYATP
jgi:hypothetical protein